MGNWNKRRTYDPSRPICRADPVSALQPLVDAGYEVKFLSHAEAVLTVDFPAALDELHEVLLSLTIPIEEIIGSGGGETKGTQRLRRALNKLDWLTREFTIDKRINGVPRESVTHKMDHVREIASRDGTPSVIALEIEWNNKDPFFDRDLENFKRLHAEGAISVGIVVTRGSALQVQMRALVRRWVDERQINDHADLERHGVTQTVRQKREVLKRVEREVDPIPFREAWVNHFVGDKYGMATTHWSKLDDRVRRGVGNPCPLVLIGIPDRVVTFGEDPAVVARLLDEGAAAADDDPE